MRPPTQPNDDPDFKTEWKQVIDILWSDPTPTDSNIPNKRGAGECFGPDTSTKFLQKHNLTTLIRSHECKSDGYEIVHNGNVSELLINFRATTAGVVLTHFHRVVFQSNSPLLHLTQVITVFSASNYYEIGSNKGSYIKFGANSDRYFVQFTAAASKTRKLTFRQQVDNVEKSAIRELKQQLRDEKVNEILETCVLSDGIL